MQETKQQLIENICRRNPSTSPEFLRRFTEETLQLYLARLTTLVGHRGCDSGWVRPRGPAVSTNHPEPVPIKPRRAAASF